MLSNAWHFKTSPDFNDCVRDGVLPILPVASFCRWRAYWPLDAEEIILDQLLQTADALLLPPLRHCPQQDPKQTLTVSVHTAWEMLADIVRSIHASGFRKCVFVHAHPLLADWLDAGLRDLRIETGMGLYRISLEALDCCPADPAFQQAASPLILQPTPENLPFLDPAREKLKGFLQEINRHPNPPPLRST